MQKDIARGVRILKQGSLLPNLAVATREARLLRKAYEWL